MPIEQDADLSAFDNQTIDGLDFCGKVYDLLDKMYAQPDGIAKIRLRSSRREKRLIEELLPIASYVQARYRGGLRIKVRWSSGSQPYDAVIFQHGNYVNTGFVPDELRLEVTTAVHQNEHLARRLLHEKGGHSGVNSISRDKKTDSLDATG